MFYMNVHTIVHKDIHMNVYMNTHTNVHMNIHKNSHLNIHIKNHMKFNPFFLAAMSSSRSDDVTKVCGFVRLSVVILFSLEHS